MVIWVKIFERYQPVLYVKKDSLRYSPMLYIHTGNTMVDVYMSLDGRLFATKKSIMKGEYKCILWQSDGVETQARKN